MQLLSRHRVKFFIVYKLTRMNITVSIVLVYLIVNPSSKLRNPCIHAVWAHSSAASSPRNDAREHPSFVSCIQWKAIINGQRSTRVSLTCVTMCSVEVTSAKHVVCDDVLFVGLYTCTLVYDWYIGFTQSLEELCTPWLSLFLVAPTCKTVPRKEVIKTVDNFLRQIWKGKVTFRVGGLPYERDGDACRKCWIKPRENELDQSLLTFSWLNP